MRDASSSMVTSLASPSGMMETASLVRSSMLAVGISISLPSTSRMTSLSALSRVTNPLTVEPFVAHEELHGEDFVDLTPQIREDILLALPQRALCRPECRGLCPACGENLNERKCHCRVAHEPLHWHALDQLKLN